ncbi:MAG: hypothetical protein ACRDOJ_13845, partial [Nocardioidaceae bacterium]
FYAAQDLRGSYFRGHRHPQVQGAWDRLARAARQWEGHTVVISHEILVGCDEDEVRRAVESLRPHEVHIVFTARDLARQIPAMWQESVKNGRVVPFDRYLKTLQDDEPALVGKIFWRTQDVVDALRRWGTAVPADRIHVVTVPPHGQDPGVLWKRFCTVTGIDPDRASTPAGSGENVSLGLAEAELLRRVNGRLKGTLSWPEHEALLKNFMTREVLGARRDAARTGIPATDRGWVVERGRGQVEALRDRGYDVIGSLDELVPGFSGVPDASATPPSDDVIDAAVDALAVLLAERRAGRRSTATAALRGWAGALRARLPR